MNQQKPSSALPRIDAAPLIKDLILFNHAGNLSSCFLYSRAKVASCFSLSKNTSAYNPTKKIK